MKTNKIGVVLGNSLIATNDSIKSIDKLKESAVESRLSVNDWTEAFNESTSESVLTTGQDRRRERRKNERNKIK